MKNPAYSAKKPGFSKVKTFNKRIYSPGLSAEGGTQPTRQVS
ncbi:MAG: hypothetical protein BWY80_00071 [Firmicutes bacterium ADurb.Bin456]|nr:MAG: hypothetical protein BWY80_00071 [Firmicutes bacterium ADurb.Bin456]